MCKMFNKITYQDYLQTEHWKSFRERILKKYKKCFICGRKDNLQVHHLTYVNLWKEEDKDVIVLCGSCHQKVHFSKKGRKLSVFQAFLKINQLKYNLFLKKDKEKRKLVKESGNMWSREIFIAKKELSIPCSKRYSKTKRY